MSRSSLLTLFATRTITNRRASSVEVFVAEKTLSEGHVLQNKTKKGSVDGEHADWTLLGYQLLKSYELIAMANYPLDVSVQRRNSRARMKRCGVPMRNNIVFSLVTSKMPGR